MEGGCLCGAVRYRVSGSAFDSDYCHCRTCQKSIGAVVVTWMDFKLEQVTWLAGKPTEYASSEHVRRGFCRTCGGGLSFQDKRYPDYLTLTTASLDDPNLVPPNYHIYTKSQPGWLNIVDECRKFPQSRDDAST
jgi:hypothetical protein